MKCPRCNKVVDIDIPMRNAENYGSHLYILRCEHCEGLYSTYISRTVSAHDPEMVNDPDAIPDF